MLSLCRTVVDHLERGEALVLATMMDSSGSAPRSAGARMLVREDGGTIASVGGGRYEAECIQVAGELHKLGRALAGTRAAKQAATMTPQPQPGLVLDFSLRGVSDMDMICGGSLTLLLEYLPDSPFTRAAFAAGLEAERAGQAHVFITRFSHDAQGEVFAQATDGLRIASGELRRARVERFSLLPQSLMLVPRTAALPDEIIHAAAALGGSRPVRRSLDAAEFLLEPFPRPHRVIIFGGGHVSRELADLAQSLDFSVLVTDDRPEFTAQERFPGIRTELLPSLSEHESAKLLARLGIGPEDGIVILTRGHAHDREALAASLRAGAGAGYVGMIGSRSKSRAVYQSLLEQGFAQAELDAVHSPIGLAIGAQTPREIAVSIVAELIKWRHASRERAEARSGAGIDG